MAAAEPYVCGCCAGRRWIWCPDCIGGCAECRPSGQLDCPDCVGKDFLAHQQVWLQVVPAPRRKRSRSS